MAITHDDSLPEWVETGFLGDDPEEALRALTEVLQEHVAPFLSEWWDPERPIPTKSEIAALQESVRARAAKRPLPASYRGLPSVLERLAQSIRFNRRNFVNIHPTPFIPSALAGFVVALQNPNNIVEEVSGATTAMEREAVEWLATNLFGLAKAEGPWGNVVSGGTVANMTALLVARDYTYDKLSRPRPARIGARGVAGVKSGVVLGTSATHYSVDKALWFLGLGNENLIRVPVGWDERLRRGSGKDERFSKGISDRKWRDLIGDAIANDRRQGEQELQAFYGGEQSPFGLQPLNSEVFKVLYSCFTYDIPLLACVLTLGTTDTGTIERVDSDAVALLRQEDVFIHVDAASGGFAFTSERVKPLLHGLSEADAFTVDPHKMGFLNYPCGAVLFRHQNFKEQIYQEAPYLGPLAPTLEGSRPGSGSAALWLATQTIGAEGYRSAVDRLLVFTEALVAAFKKSGKFQVLHSVHLNAVAVAPLPQARETRGTINRLVRELREYVLQEGTFMVNLDRHLSAVKVLDDPGADDADILDIEAVRIVITNPLVRIEDAERLVEVMVEGLERARRAASQPAARAALMPELETGRTFSEEP